LILLVGAGATLMPWIVRNYLLTKSIVPTSVHGGAQLWYGSLQVGPYLDSRGYNPRSIFESPAFRYTSLSGVPILVHGGVSTCAIDDRGGDLSLFYWTDFAPERRNATRDASRSNCRRPTPTPPPITTTSTSRCDPRTASRTSTRRRSAPRLPPS